MYLVGSFLQCHCNTTGESSGQHNHKVKTYYAGFLASSSGDVLVMFCSTISRSLWPIRSTLSVWDGGMSFHGGLIGVIVVMIIFTHRTKRTFSRFLILSHHSFRLVLVPGVSGNFLNGNCGPR
ncbi:prolipoprotein diacylglyceryl transferase family protein [Shigella flexneri]